MNIPLNQQDRITSCTKLVFTSTSASSIVAAVKNTFGYLKSEGFISELPPYYEEISIETMGDILSWHQEMKSDNSDGGIENVYLKELYGLLSAVSLRLHELN